MMKIFAQSMSRFALYLNSVKKIQIIIQTISSLSEKYDLYEDLLIHIFETLRNDEYLRPRVEPNRFRKHLPILKSVELDDHMYTITFIRQYENASVVHFHIDWEEENDDEMIHNLHHHNRHYWELQIGEDYDCRKEGGSGSTGHYTNTFIVSPPLPDNPSGLSLVFKEENAYYKGDPAGLEIRIDLD